MDLSWNQAQREHYAQGRQVGASLSVETDRGSDFSWDRWRTLVKAGFTAWGLRPQTALDTAALLEGFGLECRDRGLFLSLQAHLWGWVRPLQRFGSTALREQIGTEGMIGVPGAHGVTEPDRGGDFLAMEARAEPTRNGYLLSGTKVFVTNATVCRYFTVYARTRSGYRPDSISAFVVDRSQPGVSVSAPTQTLGLGTAGLASLSLDRCEVDRDSLLGREGAGYLVFSESMQWERTFVVAGLVGMMDRVYQDTLASCRRRQVRGVPLDQTERVATRLGQLEALISASRMLYLKAAWALEEGRGALVESAMAKSFASDAVRQVCETGMELMGGRGYLEDAAPAQEWTHALGSLFYSGTNETQRLLIGHFLTGPLPPPPTRREDDRQYGLPPELRPSP